MTFEQMDAQLHALLQSNRQDVEEKLRFGKIPEEFPHAGDWGVRVDTVGDENWPWLRDISCMPSRCADHLHALLRQHHYVELRQLDDDPVPVIGKRVGARTYWYWKRGFSPDLCVVGNITPSRPKRKRPLEEDLTRERKRNQRLQGCTARAVQDLRGARAKHAREMEHRENELRLVRAQLQALQARNEHQWLELGRAQAMVHDLQGAMQVDAQIDDAQLDWGTIF